MSKKASIELRDLNNESEKKMSKESNIIYPIVIAGLSFISQRVIDNKSEF